MSFIARIDGKWKRVVTERKHSSGMNWQIATSVVDRDAPTKVDFGKIMTIRGIIHDDGSDIVIDGGGVFLLSEWSGSSNKLDQMYGDDYALQMPPRDGFLHLIPAAV